MEHHISRFGRQLKKTGASVGNLKQGGIGKPATFHTICNGASKLIFSMKCGWEGEFSVVNKINRVHDSVANFKLGQISYPAILHTTHVGASTHLNCMRDMTGKGPKIVCVACTGHN
jgi:hypothetical protein